ncbi:papain-like cysteine protease family protein [Streptomyces sp. NPDC085481]|uniref:papain-like cysteine protease family protein n=1 Tax=Streptomyces sp. NPDC085481 TaxID=3365727 RepID=UPI0037D56C0E
MSVKPEQSVRSAGGFVFAMQRQQQSQWCWAATSVSVDAFYNPASGWIQCLLVDDIFGTTTCCANGSTAACNRPWYLNLGLAHVGRFARGEAGPAPVNPTVAREIDARRPVAAKIDWSGGGGHFPVITGYSDLIVGEPPIFEQYLTVEDPAYGFSAVSYDSFRTRYQGSGTWTFTFFTR